MQRRTLVSALAAMGLASRAWSQKYPSGPSTVVLPLQAGSASDVAVRHMAERLSQKLGQGFAVENVAAAAGLVGLGTAIPLIVIVYLLVTGYTPMRAALWAIFLTLVCCCLRKSMPIPSSY